MAQAIARQKCYNHASREASGRCMDCRKMFCKECVSTFEGRLLCAACLAEKGAATETHRSWGAVVAPLQLLGGIVALWLVFHGTASLLTVIPSSFFDLEQTWEEYESQVPEEETDAEDAP